VGWDGEYLIVLKYDIEFFLAFGNDLFRLENMDNSTNIRDPCNSFGLSSNFTSINVDWRRVGDEEGIVY
jgi:hypothetical protein